MTEGRIGLYGGTFDPVHLGHFKVAEAAFVEAELNRVIFIPCASPPHKNGEITSLKHRLAMLNLASAGKQHFQSSGIEGKLPKPSYTIDTLRALMTEVHKGQTLFFIVGADAFLDIRTWKDFEKILNIVNIIVSPRIGYDQHVLEEMISELGYERINNGWRGRGNRKHIQVLNTVPPHISSSGIKAVPFDENVPVRMPDFGLHSDVIAYIRAHNLYQ
ncbi:MAG: nicotinate (nicotinamide) nucleotide adenylyltransferase [Desulfobulbaceae bacterium]|nr:nicotinate (nicotinamide) nucleotide adenylyltransferase [Desulfobulbaceae bacterium]